MCGSVVYPLCPMHVVTITEEQFEEAYRLAEATIKVFSGLSGHYNNNLSSHLRGKVGEIAVSEVLGDLGIKSDACWRDLSLLSAADIHSSAFRADVKTWSSRYWVGMGRCVAVGQLPKLERKADLVVWCQTHHDLRVGMRVAVMGWNSLADVRSAPRLFTGPKTGRQVDNHQVPLSEIRGLDILARSYALSGR